MRFFFHPSPNPMKVTYSIADMALWGWANDAPYILGENGFAAYRAHGLKEKLTLKTEFDEETRRNLFPQNQA